MNRAYVFPYGIEIDPSNVHQAIPVNLATHHGTLVQAARNRRLVCPYGACLEPVVLVHQEAGSEELRCFAHRPADADSPLCPYRTCNGGHNGGGPTYPPEHNLRKQIENALHVELQRNLTQRCPDVRIESSDYAEKEPCIRITGLGPPLQIRGLAPDCEALWREPFEGSVEDEEVLFFVISPDAPSLKQSFIDTHLLAKRPAILVVPAEKEGGEHTYATLPRLADRGAARQLATLDLIRVDYKHFFGLDRPAEYLFLPSPYRQAMEDIGKRLSVADLAPEEAKALRLFAKRLLVDGAAIHTSVFGQSREEAQRPFLPSKTFPREAELPNTSDLAKLLQRRESRSFCTGNPLLAPHWEKLFADAFTTLAETISSLRKQVKDARSEIATAVEKQNGFLRKLEASEAERENLKLQIDGERQAWSEREIQLGKELSEARKTAEELRKQVQDARGELATAVAKQTEILRRLDASEARRREAEGKLETVNSHLFGQWMLDHYLGGRPSARGHRGHET